MMTRLSHNWCDARRPLRVVAATLYAIIVLCLPTKGRGLTSRTIFAGRQSWQRLEPHPSSTLFLYNSSINNIGDCRNDNHWSASKELHLFDHPTRFGNRERQLPDQDLHDGHSPHLPFKSKRKPFLGPLAAKTSDGKSWISSLQWKVRRLGVAAILAASTVVAFNTNTKNPAWAALTENQQFVSDVWWTVTAQYFDPTYNGLTEEGWRAQKAQAIQAVADLGPDDDQRVVEAIQNMLASLGDPYTRYLSPEKYESLTNYARGSNNDAGIGVQLLLDPRTSNVIVMNTVEKGPAASSGMRPGDAIVEINGESTKGMTAETVASKCRGEAGAKIDIVVRHGSFDVDDVDNNNNGKRNNSGGKTERLTLTRAAVKMNAIQASTFTSSSGKKIGLLKVPAFSQETPGQVIDALRSVQNDGIQAIAIDLRGNVGGYMPAGVDMSKLFLAGNRRIISEVNREGQANTYYADGIGAETELPVYLIVDGRTASAAEIFTAALQDNRRAVVVGSKTFGKGRIQNVQSVGNGSGVAVTRARYVTPKGRDLHGVGISPDKEPQQCGPKETAATCLSDIV